LANQTQHKNKFTGLNICVIIPTFNNQQTVLKVIEDVCKYTPDIIVVNDGSTDKSTEYLQEITDIELVSYHPNKGKGYAIRKGFDRALEKGFEYAITIDADGQHFADDLNVFAEKLKEEPGSLLIGSRNIQTEGMPSKNTFANKFSNFWFWAETGQKLPDTQSGFRLYPIKFYKKTKFFTSKYEFEIEILVRSAWSGIKIFPVPIKVDYPEDRVSHFRPLPDFGRISLLNTVLVLLTFLYIVPRNAVRYLTKNKFTDVIRDQFLKHNESPGKISTAIGFGIFMGILPIWGFQMLTAAFLAHFLRLNKILVLAASNISIPPAIPFIVYFSYQTGGFIVRNPENLSRENLLHLKQQLIDGQFYATFQDLGYSIYQYIVGSIAFGFGLGLLVGILLYFMLQFSIIIRRKSK
jgi:glycosyltransferase involved in cell wall biosynthesis